MSVIKLSRDWIWYGVCVLVTPPIIGLMGLTARQTFAVAGFCMILYGAIFFWKFRLAFAAFGVSLLLTLNLLDIPHLVEFSGLDIIVFLIGMMTVIGFLERSISSNISLTGSSCGWARIRNASWCC
jgi:hypothetical protein